MIFISIVFIVILGYCIIQNRKIDKQLKELEKEIIKSATKSSSNP